MQCNVVLATASPLGGIFIEAPALALAMNGNGNVVAWHRMARWHINLLLLSIRISIQPSSPICHHPHCAPSSGPLSPLPLPIVRHPSSPRRRGNTRNGGMVCSTRTLGLVATISVQYGIDERARARPRLMIRLGIFIREFGRCLSAPRAASVRPDRGGREASAGRGCSAATVAYIRDSNAAGLGRRRTRAAINRVPSNRAACEGQCRQCRPKCRPAIFGPTWCFFGVLHVSQLRIPHGELSTSSPPPDIPGYPGRPGCPRCFMGRPPGPLLWSGGRVQMGGDIAAAWRAANAIWPHGQEARDGLHPALSIVRRGSIDGFQAREACGEQRPRARRKGGMAEDTLPPPGGHSPPRHLIVHEGDAMCPAHPHPSIELINPAVLVPARLALSGSLADTCRRVALVRRVVSCHVVLRCCLLSVLQWQTCDVIKKTPRIEIELAEHSGDPGIWAPAHLGRWHVKEVPGVSCSRNEETDPPRTADVPP